MPLNCIAILCGAVLSIFAIVIEIFPTTAVALDYSSRSGGEFALGARAFCNAQGNFVLGGGLSAEQTIRKDRTQRGFLDLSLGLANSNYRYSGKVGFSSQRYDIGVRNLFLERKLLFGIGMSARERVFRQSTFVSQNNSGFTPENSPVITFKDRSLGILFDFAYESESPPTSESHNGYFLSYGVSYVYYLRTYKPIESSEDFDRLGSESRQRNMRSMLKTSDRDLSLYLKLGIYLL